LVANIQGKTAAAIGLTYKAAIERKLFIIDIQKGAAVQTLISCT